jgi:hypothetical protein
MVVRGRQTSSLERCCGLRETGEEERTRWARMRLELARSKQASKASKQASAGAAAVEKKGSTRERQRVAGVRLRESPGDALCPYRIAAPAAVPMDRGHDGRIGQCVQEVSVRAACPLHIMRPLATHSRSRRPNLVSLFGQPVESSTSSPNTLSALVGPLRRTSPRLQTHARGLCPKQIPPSVSDAHLCLFRSCPPRHDNNLYHFPPVVTRFCSIRPAMSSQTLASCFRQLSFLPSALQCLSLRLWHNSVRQPCVRTS